MERRNGEDAEPVERVLGALRNVRQTLRHNNIELDLQTLRQRRQVELVAATSVLVDAGHRGRPGGSQRIVVAMASRRRGRRRFRQTSSQRIAARSLSLAHHLARLLTSWARRSSSDVAVAAQLLTMALLLFAGRVASTDAAALTDKLLVCRGAGLSTDVISDMHFVSDDEAAHGPSFVC